MCVTQTLATEAALCRCNVSQSTTASRDCGVDPRAKNHRCHAHRARGGHLSRDDVPRGASGYPDARLAGHGESRQRSRWQQPLPAIGQAPLSAGHCLCTVRDTWCQCLAAIARPEGGKAGRPFFDAVVAPRSRHRLCLLAVHKRRAAEIGFCPAFAFLPPYCFPAERRTQLSAPSSWGHNRLESAASRRATSPARDADRFVSITQREGKQFFWAPPFEISCG